MSKKLKVGVVFGGRSGEHDVSLNSASSVMSAMDKEKYEIIPIGITKGGVWFTNDEPLKTLKEKKSPTQEQIITIPADPNIKGFIKMNASNTSERTVTKLDVIFPVLHGTFGEDGTVQGLFDLACIPYVGAGVAGSAVGMDKAFMKMILKQEGLPVGDYLFFVAQDWQNNREGLLARIVKELSYPCFVKPANLGSSVGISMAENKEELIEAIKLALEYDRKIVVEKNIDSREIECSVLGNEEPEASIPGEIIPGNKFYDYKAKYIDNNSRLLIPAPLSKQTTQKVQELAVKVFKALDCFGLGRVDFFVDEEKDEIYVIEINTIPGFTDISMYPKLWEYSGVNYASLIDRLIELALDRQKERENISTEFSTACGD